MSEIERCKDCGRSDDNCVCHMWGHLDNPFLDSSYNPVTDDYDSDYYED